MNAVTIVHDADWQQFPEVGEALKQMSGEENCFAVATCPARGRWAIGVASGWKGRECATKLAISLALLADQPMRADLARSYPGFQQLCAAGGIGIGGAGGCQGCGGLGGLGGGDLA